MFDAAASSGWTKKYFATLSRLAELAEATDQAGQRLSIDQAMERMVEIVAKSSAIGGKAVFIGNGGSAGIASHMAVDYAKNAGYRATALNDAAMLTCLGNDFGYEHVFAKQIEMIGMPADVLVAISSSGRSPNILLATDRARDLGCAVVTLSGFDADNPLRRKGDVNIYVASHQYGYVEVLHMALCHAAIDLACTQALPMMAVAK